MNSIFCKYIEYSNGLVSAHDALKPGGSTYMVGEIWVNLSAPIAGLGQIRPCNSQPSLTSPIMSTGAYY